MWHISSLFCLRSECWPACTASWSECDKPHATSSTCEHGHTHTARALSNPELHVSRILTYWFHVASISNIYFSLWQKAIIYDKNIPVTVPAAAKSLQLCPTLCDPIDGSPPGSPVPGILQARTLEWVAISFPNAWKWKVKVKSLSGVRPSVTPWTAAFQAPPSMGFSRQEYRSGVPLPSPWQYLASH